MGCLVCAFAYSRPVDPAVDDRLLIGSGDCHEECVVPYGPLDLRLTRLVPASAGAVGGDIGADFAALGCDPRSSLARSLHYFACLFVCFWHWYIYGWVFLLMFQLDRQTDRQSNIINMRIEIELVLMNQIEKVTVCLSFLFLAYTTSHAHI